MKTTFFVIFSCLILVSAIAQEWPYQRQKLDGKYIAEVYSINNIDDQVDSILLQVLSFNEQFKTVEEVEQNGLQSKKIYNLDGTVQSITSYSYNNKTVSMKKKELQYENGLEIAATDYELKSNNWQKVAAHFTKYRFNEYGQVIQSTYSNEDGVVYHDAFMTYDTKLKPKQLYYYDDFGNLMLPGCVEVKVIIQNSVHHFDLYQYDSAANIMWYSMAYENKKPSYQYNYNYNDKGQLISYDYFNGDIFDKRCVFEYLSNGLIASIKTYRDQNQKQIQENLFYKYP